MRVISWEIWVFNIPSVGIWVFTIFLCARDCESKLKVRSSCVHAFFFAFSCLNSHIMASTSICQKSWSYWCFSKLFGKFWVDSSQEHFCYTYLTISDLPFSPNAPMTWFFFETDLEDLLLVTLSQTKDSPQSLRSSKKYFKHDVLLFSWKAKHFVLQKLFWERLVLEGN